MSTLRLMLDDNQMREWKKKIVQILPRREARWFLPSSVCRTCIQGTVPATAKRDFLRLTITVAGEGSTTCGKVTGFCLSIERSETSVDSFTGPRTDENIWTRTCRNWTRERASEQAMRVSSSLHQSPRPAVVSTEPSPLPYMTPRTAIQLEVRVGSRTNAAQRRGTPCHAYGSISVPTSGPPR